MKVGGGTLFLLAHALWSLSFGAPKLAAAPGELLDIIPRLLGSVTGLELDDQGRVYVAGIFTIEGESTARTLIRLLPDGSLDTSFNITVGTGTIRAVEHHAGKLLVGGNFTTLNSDSNLAGIARLNLDGSVDPTFKPPKVRTPSGQGVQLVHVDSGGDVLLAGFMDARESSISARGFLRLASDGSIARQGNLLAKPSVLREISPRFAESMPRGRTVFGGDSTEVNYQSHGGVFELDSTGELTPRFVWATNYSNLFPQGRVMAMLPDDTLVKEGTNKWFTADKFPLLAQYVPEGKPREGFRSFEVFPKSNLSGLAQVHVQPDGKILVLGEYQLEGESKQHQLFRLHADGSLDESFQITKFPMGNYGLLARSVQDGLGRLWIGRTSSPSTPQQVSLFLVSGEAESLIPKLYAVPMPDGTLQLRYKAHSGAQKWVAQRSATLDGGWEDVATPDQPDKFGSATIDTTQIPTPAYFRLRRATAP